MVILLLIDGFLREYELKKQGQKQAEEILKEIERDTKEEKENEEDKIAKDALEVSKLLGTEVKIK